MVIIVRWLSMYKLAAVITSASTSSGRHYFYFSESVSVLAMCE